MAYLLDLPPAARRELAARWGTEETTVLLYRTMTEPAAIESQLEALGSPARAALVRLACGPATPGELLAQLPLSAERLAADLAALADLGLVLRQPEGSGPPRAAAAPLGDETLYVPADVAAALGERTRARG